MTSEDKAMDREQTTLRLPVDLMEKLRQQAQERGYTVNDLIMFILRDYLRSISQE